MKVTEIYVTIQGEGRLMGSLCTILRLYGCNLQCSTCDQINAKTHYVNYTLSQLIQTLSPLPKNVVVTGGEPMLQKHELFQLIQSTNKTYFLETNGTITDPQTPNLFQLITLSPKRNYKKLHEIFKFWVNFDNVDFKFVVGRSEWTWKFNDILKTVNKYQIPKERVWVMSEGRTAKEIDRYAAKVWDFCVINGFNYSDRLHLRVGRK